MLLYKVIIRMVHFLKNYLLKQLHCGSNVKCSKCQHSKMLKNVKMLEGNCENCAGKIANTK